MNGAASPPGDSAVAALTWAEAPIYKGHGTENDFIIVLDPDGELDLTEGVVRALCDRRAGIGADGVLRVVRSEQVDLPVPPMPAHEDRPAAGFEPEYFMDYRNADGSVAEMCGNGLRVFVRFLHDSGLVADVSTTVRTRAGDLAAFLEPDGQITVDLGVAQLLEQRPSVRPRGWTGSRAGRAVLMPNPHVVIELGEFEALADLDLLDAPLVEHPLPQGQNIEFVRTLGQRHLALRVHERGVGETRSCGTGIGAVVAVRIEPGDLLPWRVDVPGGSCTVRRDVEGRLWLTGPAVIVGRIELDSRWRTAHLVAEDRRSVAV